jgi:hypothetical protein
MKIKNLIEQMALTEKSPEQWSGEYVSDYLFQLNDAFVELMMEKEMEKLLGAEKEKIQRMTSTMNEVFGLMINLVSNVPYSTLREVKLVNKDKMLDVGYAISDLNTVSDRQNEINRMLDEKMVELHKALEKMNERLQ